MRNSQFNEEQIVALLMKTQLNHRTDICLNLKDLADTFLRWLVGRMSVAHTDRTIHWKSGLFHS